MVFNHHGANMLFKLGAVVATPAALRFCALHNIQPTQLIARHAAGDWGELTTEDVQSNVQAVQHDLRILSSYPVGDGKVWIITEADRSSTCLLLPEDY
jgi:hypothetical protein